jgi:hypothetical protein
VTVYSAIIPLQKRGFQKLARSHGHDVEIHYSIKKILCLPFLFLPFLQIRLDFWTRSKFEVQKSGCDRDRRVLQREAIP